MNEVSLNRLVARMEIAAEIWTSIEKTVYPADRWMGNYFHQNRRRMGSRDRKFYSEIIYGVFRHKSWLQAVASQYISRKYEAQHLVLLGAALEQVISDLEFRVLLREWIPRHVRLPKDFYESFTGFSLFGKGNDLASLCLRYSFPEWLAKRWEADFGLERVQELLRVYQIRPDLIVRTNTIKISREKLMKLFSNQGFETRRTRQAKHGIVFENRIGIFALEEFQKGFFEVQDEGSQLVCEAMHVRPSDLVWDVCAGAGGKSLYLAALMENKGRVVATDIRHDKLTDLKKRAKRAGAFNIFPADLERMDELKAARDGFDKILVDAPCSGSGTLRRNPDARWKLTPERFEDHHREQVEIILSAWKRLKKGGRLYYVTCSIDRLENEKTMEAAKSQLPDMKICTDAQPGEIGDWGGRLWPSEENDGFFMAIAEKIE